MAKRVFQFSQNFRNFRLQPNCPLQVNVMSLFMKQTKQKIGKKSFHVHGQSKMCYKSYTNLDHVFQLNRIHGELANAFGQFFNSHCVFVVHVAELRFVQVYLQTFESSQLVLQTNIQVHSPLGDATLQQWHIYANWCPWQTVKCALFNYLNIRYSDTFFGR